MDWAVVWGFWDRQRGKPVTGALRWAHACPGPGNARCVEVLPFAHLKKAAHSERELLGDGMELASFLVCPRLAKFEVFACLECWAVAPAHLCKVPTKGRGTPRLP